MFTQDQIAGKNVLVRADLDVSVESGRVVNNYRLQALIPTLRACLQSAKKVCLIGHRGRPDGNDLEFSLKPVAEELKRLLNQDINVIDSGFSPGDYWKGENPLSIIENLRFDNREENLDEGYARDMATGADIYIYEAFATYRSCTSLSLIPEYLPTVTGLRFDEEIKTLLSLLTQPQHPSLLLASGAKGNKMAIINQISPKFDQTILAGKFALAESLTEDGFDINNHAIEKIIQAISISKTIVMNGPLGRYEDGIHNVGTKKILKALKESDALTVLGGGDTLAAIPSLGFAYTDYGFVSTGGGAMLDFLVSGSHPILEKLK